MASLDDKELIPYKSIIKTADYENLAIILLVIGFCLASYFFIYGITYKKEERSFMKEVILGFYSSVFLAGGTLFAFLAAGVYL